MTTALLYLLLGLAFGWLATRSIGYERPIIVLARPSEQGIIEHPDGSRERHQWTAAQVSALLDSHVAQRRLLVRFTDERRDAATGYDDERHYIRRLN